MQEDSSKQPGNKGSVLYRIPRPVATPTKGNIGPVSTHNDTGTQGQCGKDNPGPGLLHPAHKITFDHPVQSQDKGYHG